MDIAVEVAKAYYRNVQSPRLESDHLEDLTGLLSQDHFHLGVKPVDHIRRLEIPLEQDALIRDDDRSRYMIHSMDGLDVFQRHLEVLLDVRVKKGFELTIKLTWSGYHIYCMPALEQSRTVVDKLLEKGAKVTVLAFDEQLRKQYDVSDYYMLSSVDWQGKWIRKVKKDHRRSGFFSSSYHDSLDPFAGDFTVPEDMIDESDSEEAAEQEKWEDEQDEAFVKALAGLGGPTRSAHMSFTPPHAYGFSDEELDLEDFL